MNHIRDDHEKTEICSHFIRNMCKFPDNVCWKIHKTTQAAIKGKEIESQMSCL